MSMTLKLCTPCGALAGDAPCYVTPGPEGLSLAQEGLVESLDWERIHKVEVSAARPVQLQLQLDNGYRLRLEQARGSSARELRDFVRGWQRWRRDLASDRD